MYTIYNLYDIMVIVAQLAEHHIVVLTVVGSSPIYHPLDREPVNLIVSYSKKEIISILSGSLKSDIGR